MMFLLHSDMEQIAILATAVEHSLGLLSTNFEHDFVVSENSVCINE